MENIKNSKCFERLVKYQDVDIKYPPSTPARLQSAQSQQEEVDSP